MQKQDRLIEKCSLHSTKYAVLKDNNRRPLMNQDKISYVLCVHIKYGRKERWYGLACFTCLICIFIKVNGHLNVTGLQNGNEDQPASWTYIYSWVKLHSRQ